MIFPFRRSHSNPEFKLDSTTKIYQRFATVPYILGALEKIRRILNDVKEKNHETG